MRLSPLFFCAQLALAGASEVFHDVDYVGKGNPSQTLDLIAPGAKATTKLPLVVFIHGGAWSGGSKRDGIGIVQHLAGTGQYAAATINYRLSQEAIWPAQIFDCKAAIRFLRGKAGEYGIDPDKIGVFGMSAGGHLVAMLGTCPTEKSMEGDLGAFPTVSSRVQCVVDFFGPTDFLTISKDPLVGNPVTRLLGGINPQLTGKAKLASPVTWVTKDTAPFFIAHGTADPLVPYSQSTEIDELLDKAGVPSDLIAVQGAGHGFNSPTLNARVQQFLDKYLRGQDSVISCEPIPAK